MITFLFRRLLQSILVIVGLVAVVFFVTNLLGDPARLMLRPEATEEDVQALRERLGLNEPLGERFVDYMANALQGDFGESLWQRVPAMDVALDRLPNTLYLMGVTLLIAVPLAFVLGVVSALRPGTLADRFATIIGLGGVSTADFWLGLMLVFVFAVELGWLPTSGFGGPEYVILPSIALAARPMGRLSQMIRDSLSGQLRQVYVTTARAKGLRERTVIYGHALRNAAIPVITVAGDETAALLTGAVVIETVFGWPGLGFLLIQAIERRDLPLIVSCVVLIATAVVIINFIVDLFYTVIDPRVRLK
jgi:peptide/nickel transport system permease protein